MKNRRFINKKWLQREIVDFRSNSRRNNWNSRNEFGIMATLYNNNKKEKGRINKRFIEGIYKNNKWKMGRVVI